MKIKRGLIFVLLIIFTFLYIYYIYIINSANIILNNTILIIVIILGLYIIRLLLKDKNDNIKYKEKLYNSLEMNSDTVYIMIDDESRKVIYLSNNIEEILGIKKADLTDDEIVYKLLNIPILKTELNSWNKSSKYVSQMIEYDNPKYKYQMWIKVKIFPVNDVKDNYYIIEIIDATKDHDRQHLLVSQASDIKARESQLNQITASSYDFEIDIDTIRNLYELKYFKSDNLYFGEEKSGNYTEGLKEILTYINENDRKLVYSNLSLENLKEHFEKYELSSINIRYRIGNEIKNNTWLESTIFFLSSKQRNKVSILTKNVTQKAESIREQNVMLQNALNDTKMASKAKTNLISTISHDIRTPLTNIIGFSDSLLDKDITSDIKDDILNIKSSSLEVLDIIDELIDTSNVEKKVIKKDEKEYSILKMFKKLETDAKEYIGNKDIKFDLNLDSNLPVILFGDDIRIYRALTRLVNNSVKYTDEGCINVTVRGEKKDNFVDLTVIVEDTGVGIEEAKINAIINSKNTTSGIGYVKNLIELLDGKLEIESKVGKYTKITVTYRQKIVEDNKVRELIKNNKIAQNFSLKGKKVLVVDDNKLNLKVTKRMLELYDLEVVLLESGEECLELINEGNTFDLIFLDQMMPGMDGITTLNNLRKIENFTTPVVVLTADAMEGKKEIYLNSGFDDYISKPIDKSELSRVLKKFIKI